MNCSQNQNLLKRFSGVFTLFLFGFSVFFIISCSKNSEQMKEEKLKEDKAKVEKALTEFSEKLAVTNIDSSSSYGILKEYIEKNNFVYGAAFAVQNEDEIGNVSGYCTYVYLKEGRPIMKVLPSYRTQEWFTAPVNSKSGVWSKPYFDTEGGEANMITYSIPIYSKDSTAKLIGVVTSDLKLD